MINNVGIRLRDFPILSTLMLCARLVLLAGAVLVLSACDGLYFRRIDITGSDTAGFAVDGAYNQAVISALREYAALAHLRCSSTNELPFECSRIPIRVRVESSEHAITVCYDAHGTAFERAKFEHRMNTLESMLVARFGAQYVSHTDMCPRPFAHDTAR